MERLVEEYINDFCSRHRTLYQHDPTFAVVPLKYVSIPNGIIGATTIPQFIEYEDTHYSPVHRLGIVNVRDHSLAGTIDFVYLSPAELLYLNLIEYGDAFSYQDILRILDTEAQRHAQEHLRYSLLGFRAVLPWPHDSYYQDKMIQPTIRKTLETYPGLSLYRFNMEHVELHDAKPDDSLMFMCLESDTVELKDVEWFVRSTATTNDERKLRTLVKDTYQHLRDGRWCVYIAYEEVENAEPCYVGHLSCTEYDDYLRIDQYHFSDQYLAECQIGLVHSWSAYFNFMQEFLNDSYDNVRVRKCLDPRDRDFKDQLDFYSSLGFWGHSVEIERRFS